MPAGMNITQLLADYRNGHEQAMESLFPIVYEELRRIARKQLYRVSGVNTLCATALVNEAYLKLLKCHSSQASDRVHFFAIAATAMRQILINYAQQKHAQKRGGDWLKVTFEEALSTEECGIDQLLAINRALEELEQLDENLARLIELRFFAGLTEIEVASIFEVNERTVRRNWKKAKALLVKILADY